MTGGLRRLAAKGAGVALALALAACGKVLEYPDEVAENSAALCSDGNDNDYDGNADCDDEECDGFCHEESAAECSDGRDNDGDGLADAADPRCWPRTPPKAERCAEATGLSIFETFDDWFWWPSAGAIRGAWSWRAWGVTRTGGGIYSTVRNGIRHGDGGRTDGLAVFSGTSFYADVPGTSLGSLVRQEPFSGSFDGFELSFGASLPPNAVLRVGIVPVALAPSASAPLSGAENGLLSVSIDTGPATPELIVNIEGSAETKAVAGCTRPPCTDSLGRLQITVDDDGLRVIFTSADGSLTEFRPKAASPRSIPPSRLVFWGGTNDPEAEVRLDDVVLRVKPERPCGLFAPQIPGPVCTVGGSAGAFGQSVSVARSAGGGYCALVAESDADPSLGPALPAPRALTVWGSPDGEAWVSYSSLEPPFFAPHDTEGGPGRRPGSLTLSGGGIAADEDGLHAAVLYGGQLGFFDGESCERLESTPVVENFPVDAEAPSYVILEGRHYVYYTRPPGDSRRTLWRAARDALQMPHELVATLPAEVGAPVSVSRVGARDLVLAYPRVAQASGGSNASLGLLVLGADAENPNPIPLGSIVEPPPRPDLWEGQGRFAFDDRGVISATLAWDADGGFLLYGGVSTTGRVESARDQPELAVGTARLVQADQVFPSDSVVPNPCGDGTCGAGETCTTCRADCSCDEPVLLHDVFTADEPWQLVAGDPSPAFDPTFARYLSGDPPVLNWLGSLSAGGWSWSVLSLEQPVQGDFELSFDWLARWRPALSCAVYVGLGAMDPESTTVRSPDGGVFARLKKDETCVDGFFAKPFVPSEDTEQTLGVGSCTGADAIPTDRWQRLLLRRRGAELSVVTLRADACESSEQTVDSRVNSELTSLLIGFGGDGFEDCAPSPELGAGSPMQGTIANVELRVQEGDP